ncbi:MAG: AarF/ABC1/UbiB kinase family protein [Myxococcales bacterium]|nr:AarF/ABC1/UbiB kinase family protein [Myxococcales bacterium]
MAGILDTVKDLGRLRQIVQVLIRHGFGEIVTRAGLGSLVPGKTKDESKGTAAERIRLVVTDLGPSFVKLGQILSTRPDLIPLDIIEELKKLQDQVPPVPVAQILQQIQLELGAPVDQIYARFDPEPLASASIGQVHRATLQTADGTREVVVKVQYPGVDEAVDSDLAHLKLVLRASGLVKVPRQALDAVFREIRTRLHEELDYCNEADNVRLFREYHGERHPWVVVPEVVSERSSARVLTLTFEPGDHIDELDGRYDPALRDLLGERIFRMFAAQLFDLRAIHADPNPGNFAFRPDGTIVLYDYGCIKAVDPTTLTAYRATIRAGLDEDYPAVERGLLDLGVRNPAGPAIEPDYYKPWRDAFALPFVTDQAFDYGASTIHDDVLRLVPGALKRMASFQPPVELVFINRMIAGHYGNLRKLQVRGRFLPLVEPYIDGA